PDYELTRFYKVDSFFRFYMPFYQFFPSLFKIPYQLTSNAVRLKATQRFLELRYQESIEKFLAQENPDICISTYFMYNFNLDTHKNINRKPFINIVPDPRSIHPLFISSAADANFVFDDQAKKNGQHLHPEATYIPSGWFVRPQFEDKYDQISVRKELKLDEKMFTIFVASGSEGTTMIMKVLPALVLTPAPVQIVVACGNNNNLLKGISGLKKLLKSTNSANKLIGLHFTKDIHKYMQAADLVVGKAGPNMLFESVATRTPFFAITHISGQEDGNLDIIRDYNLGYVEENPLKAQKLLHQIIENPAELHQFVPYLKTMAEYNQGAKKKLVELVEKLIN
ncbi:MAG TPA: glycosyltransferase, partial [Patescibacteria group bacterium]